MSRERGFCYNLAGILYDPTVVNVLKHWQATSDDPLHCPDYVLAHSFKVEDPNPTVIDEVRMDSMITV